MNVNQKMNQEYEYLHYLKRYVAVVSLSLNINLKLYLCFPLLNRKEKGLRLCPYSLLPIISIYPRSSINPNRIELNLSRAPPPPITHPENTRLFHKPKNHCQFSFVFRVIQRLLLLFNSFVYSTISAININKTPKSKVYEPLQSNAFRA